MVLSYVGVRLQQGVEEEGDWIVERPCIPSLRYCRSCGKSEAGYDKVQLLCWNAYNIRCYTLLASFIGPRLFQLHKGKYQGLVSKVM